MYFFFFQAEDGIRDYKVTGVQTCALPIFKEGESKGRYRCRRSTEQGGPCEKGPLPDGKCSRPIAKCAPVRSLRAVRRIFTIFVVLFSAAVLFMVLCGPFRAQFISPGPLSAQHGSPAFGRQAGVK